MGDFLLELLASAGDVAEDILEGVGSPLRGGADGRQQQSGLQSCFLGFHPTISLLSRLGNAQHRCYPAPDPLRCSNSGKYSHILISGFCNLDRRQRFGG